MKSKPRILMLVSNTPLRVGHGTAMRSYHVASALARHGDLTLAVISSDGLGEVPSDLAEECKRVIYGTARNVDSPIRLSRPQAWLHAIAAVVMPWRDSWTPLLKHAYASAGETIRSMPGTRRVFTLALRFELAVAARFFLPLPHLAFYQRDAFLSIQPTLREMLASEELDVLWFEHAINYPFVESLFQGSPRPLLACNTHNIESDLARQLARTLPTEEANTWNTQAIILRKVESRAFRAADIVVTCSEKDKELALRLAPRANISVIGNGVDTKYFTPGYPRHRASEPTILFTGVFDYAPNRDAVEYFVTDIFPLIRKSVPDCRFVFAGRNADMLSDCVDLADPYLECVSNPRDMRAEFDRAWVYVVPLRIGGGTRLKILEAMAMDCAVVSTPVGAEGIAYIDGEHLLLADNPSDFASAVTHLIWDKERRSNLESAAGKFVRDNYDWNHVAAGAPQLLEEFVGKTPSEAPHGNDPT